MISMVKVITLQISPHRQGFDPEERKRNNSVPAANSQALVQTTEEQPELIFTGRRKAGLLPTKARGIKLNRCMVKQGARQFALFCMCVFARAEPVGNRNDSAARRNRWGSEIEPARASPIKREWNVVQAGE